MTDTPNDPANVHIQPDDDQWLDLENKARAAVEASVQALNNPQDLPPWRLWVGAPFHVDDARRDQLGLTLRLFWVEGLSKDTSPPQVLIEPLFIEGATTAVWVDGSGAPPHWLLTAITARDAREEGEAHRLHDAAPRPQESTAPQHHAANPDQPLRFVPRVRVTDNHEVSEALLQPTGVDLSATGYFKLDSLRGKNTGVRIREARGDRHDGSLEMRITEASLWHAAAVISLGASVGDSVTLTDDWQVVGSAGLLGLTRHVPAGATRVPEQLTLEYQFVITPDWRIPEAELRQMVIRAANRLTEQEEGEQVTVTSRTAPAMLSGRQPDGSIVLLPAYCFYLEIKPAQEVAQFHKAYFFPTEAQKKAALQWLQQVGQAVARLDGILSAHHRGIDSIGATTVLMGAAAPQPLHVVSASMPLLHRAGIHSLEALRPIAESLDELHARGWGYLDVKPDNVGLASDRLKLYDLDAVTPLTTAVGALRITEAFTSPRLLSARNNPGSEAPELIKHQDKYGFLVLMAWLLLGTNDRQLKGYLNTRVNPVGEARRWNRITDYLHSCDVSDEDPFSEASCVDLLEELINAEAAAEASAVPPVPAEVQAFTAYVRERRLNTQQIGEQYLEYRGHEFRQATGRSARLPLLSRLVDHAAENLGPPDPALIGLAQVAGGLGTQKDQARLVEDIRSVKAQAATLGQRLNLAAGGSIVLLLILIAAIFFVPLDVVMGGH